MSDPKHTAGPWSVSIDKHNMRLEVDEQRPSITANGNDGLWYLCRMDEGCPNVHENARLIAAAPDLLEALKESLAALELNFGALHGDYDPKDVAADSIIGRARAAIAKAEGRAA